MKYKLLIVAGLAVLLATTGCKKEEQNVKHIAKIYEAMKASMNGVPLFEEELCLRQEWIWNGDKLATVKYYKSDGNLRTTATYSYTDGKMTKIEDRPEDNEAIYHIDIEYDANGRMSSIKEYGNDTLAHKYVFQYNGSDKISSYTYTHYVYGELVEQNNNVLTWEGNNIVSVIRDGEDTTTFVYDNNPNPFHGIAQSGRFFEWLSVNNAVKMNDVIDKITYDDDGYPKQIITDIYQGTMLLSSIREIEYDR